MQQVVLLVRHAHLGMHTERAQSLDGRVQMLPAHNIPLGHAVVLYHMFTQMTTSSAMERSSN